LVIELVIELDIGLGVGLGVGLDIGLGVGLDIGLGVGLDIGLGGRVGHLYRAKLGGVRGAKPPDYHSFLHFVTHFSSPIKVRTGSNPLHI
jgi:hypothetical protein